MKEKEHPNQDGEGHRQQEQIRRKIGGAGIILVGVFVDLIFVWPKSHELAYWLTPLIIFLLLIQVPKIPGKVIFYSTVALVIVFSLGYRFVPPTETSLHGWLTPADDPIPTSNRCAQSIPDGAIAVLLGDSGTWTTGNQLRVIQYCHHDLLWIARAERGLSVNADVFSGRILAEIRDGEFYLNQNNMFRMERPDPHTLIVIDQNGREALRVRFLNPKAVQLTGHLELPDCRYSATITDDETLFEPGDKSFLKECMGLPMNFKGVVIFASDN